MTEIKRYHEFKNGVEENEHGMFVRHDDHAAIVAALQVQLSRYSMSAGQADQRKSESDAVRVALGFSADADDVSPSDLVDAIVALQEQVRALAAESLPLKKFFDQAWYVAIEGCDFDGASIQELAVNLGLAKADIYDSAKHSDLVGDASDFEDGCEVFFQVKLQDTDADLREIRAQGAIEARNALVVADDGADIYAVVTDVAARIRAGEQP